MPVQLRGLIPAVLLALAGTGCVVAARPAHPPPPPSGEYALEAWSSRHPAASQELGDWVRAHPPAAERFFRWDSRHPGAAESFVVWSLRNPGAGIDAFVAGHPRWEEFDWVMEHHRRAANELMAWSRRHPVAAQELMHHPGGLHWAGTHLYRGAWELEGGRR